MSKKIQTTSNHYSSPYRPFPVALFNRMGRILQSLHLMRRTLDVEQLLAAARRKTGLDDFGDMQFLEPLRVLVDAINREAHLTPTGLLIQKKRLTDALVVRLRAHALLQQHPEINHIDLGKILVIAGLQRTGTTTLHRLLAAHPDARALISWEALNPVPFPSEKPGQPDARMRIAKAAEKGLAYLAPEFFAIHPVEYDAPEEDVLLLDLAFMSQSPEATMYVPSYARWLETHDNTPAYEYLNTLLKILHWQKAGKHWVLKTPHHMEYLDVLRKVFPQATIIQTHRDPQKTTGSFCSMVAHGRGVFSDSVDAHEVAAHWLAKVERMMRLSMAVRNECDGRGFIDVSYYDLLEDPLAVVRNIYAQADIAVSDAELQRIQETSKRNVQHRYGRHVYDLADFGLTRDAIEQRYAFYRAHYAIPLEKRGS